MWALLISLIMGQRETARKRAEREPRRAGEVNMVGPVLSGDVCYSISLNVA